MRYVNALTVAGVVVMSSCTVDAAREDVPARVTNPTTQSRAELLSVVRGALNGSSVTIAADALTNDSLLIVEPKHLAGRDLRRPEHFRLVMSGSRCVLVHEETRARLPLTGTTCRAE